MQNVNTSLESTEIYIYYNYFDIKSICIDYVTTNIKFDFLANSRLKYELVTQLVNTVQTLICITEQAI